jgi:hypothetical protein
MQSFRDYPLVRELMSLELDPSHFAFIGSAPLFVRGWIDAPGDIDIVARASAWREATRRGNIETIPGSVVHKVSLFRGTVEILDGWIPKISSADDMIDTADVINELRFVNLDIIKQVKIFLGRPKDHKHLQIISARDDGSSHANFPDQKSR